MIGKYCIIKLITDEGGEHMKKIYKIILTVIIGCFIVAYGVYWAFFDLQRIDGQEILQEVPSPNGESTIVIFDMSEGYYYVHGDEDKEVTIKFNLERKRFTLNFSVTSSVRVSGDFEIQDNQIIAYPDVETEKYVFDIVGKDKIRYVEEESTDNTKTFEDGMVLTYQVFKSAYSEGKGYPNAETYEGWDKLSVNEKIELCRIPKETLKTMSDEQLIEAVFAFPFADIFVYDHWDFGVKVLEDTSDAYAELLSRKTGLESLIKYAEDRANSDQESISAEEEFQDDLLAVIILYQEKYQEKLTVEEKELLKSISNMVQNAQLDENKG